MTTEGQKEITVAESSFTNDRGCKIFCKYFSKGHCNCPTNPRALVFVAHGLSEHCLYYEEIANRLTEKGFYVFSHDHQGHGQSEGARILIGDVRHYTADVFKHIEMVKEEYPNLPVFIVGHSMGGAITILSALDRPDFFKGVVLIGPVVTPDQDSVGSVRIFFGKLIARYFPNLPVLWLKDSGISNDENVCKKYKEDPLNYHGGLKAGTGLSLLNALMEIESKLDTIKWPFLVMHGKQDTIVAPRSSEILYEKASSEDKTILLLDESRHQPHHELEPVKSQALNALVDWLDKHSE